MNKIIFAIIVLSCGIFVACNINDSSQGSFPWIPEPFYPHVDAGADAHDSSADVIIDHEDQ
jgi:hypothetical protein